jgi:hypothetical protein
MRDYGSKPAQKGKEVARPYLNKQAEHVCNASYTGGGGRRNRQKSETVSEK